MNARPRSPEEVRRFEAAYLWAWGRLDAWAFDVGVPPDIARDALHDIALDAFRRWEFVPTGEQLLRYAHRLLRSFWRWKKHHEPWAEHESIALRRLAVDDFDDEDEATLEGVIAQLPEEDQQLVRDIASGATLRELGRRMGVSQTAVHKRFVGVRLRILQVYRRGPSRTSYAEDRSSSEPCVVNAAP